MDRESAMFMMRSEWYCPLHQTQYRPHYGVLYDDLATVGGLHTMYRL